MLLPLAAALLTRPALAEDPPAETSSPDAPAAPAPSNAELERRVDIVAAEVERLRIGESAVDADQGVNGMGPAASKVYRRESGVSLGGYGEVKYHHYADSTQSGADSGAVDSVDVHRMILYAGYKFDDRWVLNTEIEFEHVSEVAVEFAYLDFKASPAVGARAGLLLMPMGIYNELHEPTTFAAVDRPMVERYVLPSTWREIGLGVYGDLGPVSYRAYMLNGMNAAGFDSSGIRGGRQKGAKAVAENFAGVARVDLTGVAGLVVGASAYYGNSGQDLVDPNSGAQPGVSTLVYEGHLSVDLAGLRLRALYAGVALGDVAALNQALALTAGDSIGQTLSGYYAELGYDVFGPLGVAGQSLTPHLRYEALNSQASVPAGYQADPAQERSDLTFGLAYKPHDQISLKADYQLFMNQAQSGVDQLNAGVGFIF